MLTMYTTKETFQFLHASTVSMPSHTQIHQSAKTDLLKLFCRQFLCAHSLFTLTKVSLSHFVTPMNIVFQLGTKFRF